MKITYLRRGGRVPPADREALTLSGDGAFSLWRSVNTPACGRFAGQLLAGEWVQLRQAAQAAAQAGPLDRELLPDSAVETLQVDEVAARLGQTDQPEGAWGDLVAQCRALLTRLLDAPQAVVALEVAAGAAGARLVQRGGQPLHLDLSRLAVRAILGGGYYEQRGQWHWQAPPGGPRRVAAGPGWSLDLSFAHGFTPRADEVVHTYVTLAAYDQDGLVDVSLVDAPALKLA